MGLASSTYSTYYDLPKQAVDETAIVEAMFGICDEFEALATAASAQPYGSRPRS
jgi:hypothetical protein